MAVAEPLNEQGPGRECAPDLGICVWSG
jgi:hypothetical protein